MPRQAAARRTVRPAPFYIPRRLASVDEAAERYDVSKYTVRRWITTGLITGYRVGGRLVKVDLDEIEAKAI